MTQSAPAISIVIVYYKVPHFAAQTLRSLKEAQLFDRCEVIVVDNASHDGAKTSLLAEFPFVQWIELKQNIGFGKASNVGAQSARGEYLLLLNPDIIISHDTLAVLLSFCREHPDVGICGPKVLNPDGTLQKSCRRSFVTPAVAFYHFTGLSRLFPKSRKFARYNLTYMNPDESAQVDAVSGSCMFMRTELYRTLGGFDEAFFMYGEDLDLCSRVLQAGFSVWYHPATQIIHFKGKSSEKRPLSSRWAFYEAMLLFSQKHAATTGGFFPAWLVRIGIIMQAAVNITVQIARASAASLIDLFILNTILAASLFARFSISNMEYPYYKNLIVMIGLHVLVSLCYTVTFAVWGVYNKERYTATRALGAGATASIVLLAIIYYLSPIALSRIAFAASAVLTTLLLVCWREILPRSISQFKRILFTAGKVLVAGNGGIAEQLIENLEKNRSANICGILWPTEGSHPAEFKGYPVVGTLKSTAAIVRRLRPDVLLIATAEPWYTSVIETISTIKNRRLTVRWVSPHLCSEPRDRLPASIPLQDFSI